MTSEQRAAIDRVERVAGRHFNLALGSGCFIASKDLRLLVSLAKRSAEVWQDDAVERAARALYESRGKKNPWDVLHDTYKDFWKNGIRAAIAAMQPPGAGS